MLTFISDTSFRSTSWHWYNCRASYSTGTEFWYTDSHEQCHKPGFTCCIQSTDASQTWCVQVDHHLNMCGEILISLDLVKIELTNWITAWNRVFHEQLIGAQQIKNFSASYATWKFTSSCHPSFLEPYESSLNPICLWSMLKVLFYYHFVQTELLSC